MAQKAKTVGSCHTCGEYGSLTIHHVRHVPEVKGYRILLCEDCHTRVTQYEEEIKKLKAHVKKGE